jgi:hypothetical protein
MSQHEKQMFTRVGAKYALLCAAFGLLIAGAIAAFIFASVGIGLHEMILIIPTPIAVAVFSLFASAFLLGRASGALIFRFGIGSIVNPLVSITLAFACAVTATTAGVVTGILGHNSNDPFAVIWILQLIGTIVGFGSVPALILGLSFWAMIRASVNSHRSSRQIR